MALIQIRREGEPIRQGLNLYPWNDPSSIGAILRIGPLTLRVRWSKPCHRLNCGLAWET